MDTLWQDAHDAFRARRRSPGLAFAGLLTLVLAAGLTLACVSEPDAGPQPLRQPERLVRLEPDAREAAHFTPGQYTALVLHEDVLAGLAAEAEQPFRFQARGSKELLPGRFASANLFDVLGVKPALGRFLHAAEGQSGGEAEVVLSHALWTRHLGADPTVLGQTVWLSGRPFSVVGVAPEGFPAAHAGADEPALWVLLSAHARFVPETSPDAVEPLRLMLTGRLREGVSPEHARDVLSGPARGGAQQASHAVVPGGISVHPLTPTTRPPQLSGSNVLCVWLWSRCGEPASRG